VEEPVRVRLLGLQALRQLAPPLERALDECGELHRETVT
jgi:hypothetical protein